MGGLSNLQLIQGRFPKSLANFPMVAAAPSRRSSQNAAQHPFFTRFEVFPRSLMIGAVCEKQPSSQRQEWHCPPDGIIGWKTSFLMSPILHKPNFASFMAFDFV